MCGLVFPGALEEAVGAGGDQARGDLDEAGSISHGFEGATICKRLFVEVLKEVVKEGVCHIAAIGTVEGCAVEERVFAFKLLLNREAVDVLKGFLQSEGLRRQLSFVDLAVTPYDVHRCTQSEHNSNHAQGGRYPLMPEPS